MTRLFPVLLFFAQLCSASTPGTGYVTTNAQTLSVFNPSITTESASILAGPGAGQLVFSRDGSTLYVGELQAMAILVINAATNQLIKQIPVGLQVTTLAISPDNTTLYYGGIGATQVFALNVATGLSTGAVPVPQPSTVNCIALSNTGDMLYVSYGQLPEYQFVSCGAYQAQFYNKGGVLSASTSTFQVLLKFNTSAVPALALAPTSDGSALVVGTPLGVTRFNSTTGQIEKSITLSTPNPLTALALTPDGAGLIVGQLDAPILLLDPATLVQQKQDPNVQATSFAFSPDGATCFYANNATQPSILGSFSLAAFGSPTQRTIPLATVSLAVSPLNSAVYVTNTNYATFSLSSATGALGGFLETPGFLPPVPNMSGKIVYCYGESQGIQVYAPAEPLPAYRILLPTSDPYASALYVSQGGGTGYAALEASHFTAQVAIGVIDLASGKVAKTIPFPASITPGTFTFAGISPDGSVFYFQSEDDEFSSLHLVAWNHLTGATGKTQLKYSGSDSLLISPDGNYVYVATAYAVTQLDASTLATTHSLAVTGVDQVGGLGLGNNGSTVYAGFGTSETTSELLAIDVASFQVTQSLNGLPFFLSFAATPDGTRAYATTYGAQSLTVIDLSAFQELAPIQLPGNPIFIAFTPQY